MRLTQEEINQIDTLTNHVESYIHALNILVKNGHLYQDTYDFLVESLNITKRRYTQITARAVDVSLKNNFKYHEKKRQSER